MIDKKSIIVYNVISSNRGGGAEVLVKKLNSSLYKYGIKSYAIYGFPFGKENLLKNEVSLDLDGPRNIKFLFKLRKILKKNQSTSTNQILHLHLTWPLIYGLLASIGLNYKVLYTEHNTFNKKRNFPLARLFDLFFYLNCKKIICISNETERKLLKWQLGLIKKEKIKIIYNGAKSFNFKIRKYDPMKGLNLISIGSLTYQKGFDVSIRAISEIPDLINSYVILGEGEMRNKLLEIIKKNNLGEKVKLLGFKENIQEYLDNSDLGLIPSRWEGFGLVTFEMLSSGLPLLINKNYGGPKEIKECNSVFLKDISSVNNLIFFLKKIRTKLLKNDLDFHDGRNLSKKFSLDNFCSNYADLYKSL
tara:strand:- start:4205 stop:5287 length:1083 start_codon:yes stop_codon:yes gene_type:complete